MAYSYLLDLYRVLDEREQEIRGRQAEPAASRETRYLLEGRLDAVTDFHSFLKENFHSRLPRRLR